MLRKGRVHLQDYYTHMHLLDCGTIIQLQSPASFQKTFVNIGRLSVFLTAAHFTPKTSENAEFMEDKLNFTDPFVGFLNLKYGATLPVDGNIENSEELEGAWFGVFNF